MTLRTICVRACEPIATMNDRAFERLMLLIDDHQFLIADDESGDEYLEFHIEPERVDEFFGFCKTNNLTLVPFDIDTVRHLRDTDPPPGVGT